MTQIVVRSKPVPINFQVGSALGLSDQERFELCARNPEFRIERTAEGNLIVMTPVGGEVLGFLLHIERVETHLKNSVPNGELSGSFGLHQ